MTVLLSSHILAEVQQVCTSATIIGNGRMLASGRVEDLLGAQHVVPRAASPTRAAARGAGRRPASTVRRDGDGAASSRPTEPGERITQALGAAGIWLTELTPVRADLETVFLELTAGDQEPADGVAAMIAPAAGRAHPAALAPRGRAPAGSRASSSRC